MKWDDFREMVKPLIDYNKKPEKTRIQIFETLFSLVDINPEINQWAIYEMKLGKYPQYSCCPWYEEHIENYINGKVAHIIFLLMEHEILLDLNTPNEKNPFSPLADSINEGYFQISRETHGFFGCIEDMILSTEQMVSTHKSRPDSGIMDLFFGLGYFSNVMVPDPETILKELLYYKLNNKYHEIIRSIQTRH